MSFCYFWFSPKMKSSVLWVFSYIPHCNHTSILLSCLSYTNHFPDWKFIFKNLARDHFAFEFQKFSIKGGNNAIKCYLLFECDESIKWICSMLLNPYWVKFTQILVNVVQAFANIACWKYMDTISQRMWKLENSIIICNSQKCIPFIGKYTINVIIDRPVKHHWYMSTLKQPAQETNSGPSNHETHTACHHRVRTMWEEL